MKTVKLKITNIVDLDKGIVEVSEQDILNNFAIKRLIAKAFRNKIKKIFNVT